jgi:hypothetical protein
LVVIGFSATQKESKEGTAPNTNDKDAAVEKARAAANSFLNTLINEDESLAYTFLSKDYREHLSEEERKSNEMKVAVVDGKCVMGWTHGPGKLSENKEQATFEGFLDTKKYRSRHSYRLIMVKENDSWRVNLLDVNQEGRYPRQGD